MADRIMCSCVTCPGCGTWVVVEPEIARAGGSNNKDKARTRCPLTECAKEFVFETNEAPVFKCLRLCSSVVTSTARNCIDLGLANPGALLPLTAVSPRRLHRRSEEHTSELQSLRHLVCR